ncbi:arylamine N-acetyltransferase family protein [Bacillus pseudomycoides]|uniref:arylamine N-acetyltransferase family protein n=1 Tax=Bacillus pseudomycoides TaxID=64104 RepID=UPI000BEFF7A1|nr:arylamine N-acetyltransferase [Bacillus pseudomycoides]PEJ39808.1 arylamine N-acetyltransferase [Bacillus pseudomycoides]PHA94728.1 arylamine N-acetyltransferase [Bacillus pseudomycoides]PHB28169.1 arylamine N-acetyltransferase [Bacillus pseudomycoides]PHC71651.1 arylamine N-acetyltransferase [Bacillus pseudomycoides]
MTELQDQFFARLNLKKQQTVRFEDLNKIISAIAYEIPFENLDIVTGNTKEISKENLQKKILMSSRGGLCYEMNSILYYLLKDCGFDVKLALGTVYKSDLNVWALEESHITIILNYDSVSYLADVGIASLVPLTLVPFTGETVTSKNGEYRVRRKDTDKGTYILERRDTHSWHDPHEKIEWKVCHAFRTDPIDETTLNEVQRKVIEDENSSFNKGLIAVKLTHSGYVSLTKDSLTQVMNGQKRKSVITENHYKKLLHDIFNIEM